MNKPLTAISANGPISSSTVAFRNPVAQALQNITQIERAQEEERLEKRRRRAATGDPSRSVSLALDAPGPCTPGSFGLTAPDIETRKGAKAKEQMSAAARKATEAQQHAATTKTMNMALGISLPGKKLSWMSKGADAGPSNPFLAGRPNANAQSSKVGASGANGVTGSLPKSRVIGDFREDKETGAGIQLRDMVSVLEHDGKEKRALQRAYGRLGGQER